jgi:hypothetical protein
LAVFSSSKNIVPCFPFCRVYLSGFAFGAKVLHP